MADDRHIRFGEHVVDLSARTVERSGEPISLEPQVFDVLAVLIEHRERVVTKLELFDRVWGDRFVSPATLTSRIRDLRAALGDSGRNQHVIKTAHGRGFRFVADVVSVPTDRHDLPALIGRTSELGEVDRCLESERLVTLVGPGGVGKTHLMRHAIVDRGADLCELTEVRDGASLARAVLVSIGASERPGEQLLDVIVERLGASGRLLAIDNCEHVIDEVTALVAELNRRCPDLRILATSRRPLRLAGERVIRVGPLDAEAAHDLLLDGAARHGVDLTGHDTVVDHLCERLDRLPLALELAASKVRALPIDDLGRMLDQRFAVLTSDAHDVVDHHRSLDEAIRWSVDLLTPSQRDLLARLAVFVGGFTLVDVDAVCGSDSVADLIALVDLSLVSFDPTDGRYRLLESIRMFAERLDRPDGAVERFREHVVATVERAGMLEVGSTSHDIEAIRSAWPSVRSVVRAARDTGDAVTVHRIIAGVTRYAEQTFAFEVIDWATAAREMDRRVGEVTPIDTELAVALLLTHRGDFDDATDHLTRIEERDDGLAALTRMWHAYFTGDLGAADRHAARIREVDGGSGSYVEVVGAIASQFLDKGAQRTFDPEVTARLDELDSGGDPVVAAGVELCCCLRLDWDEVADVAIERLSGVIDTAQSSGLAFLTSGASTARSLALSVAPSAESSARVLRATLRSYAEASSWQFALADFGSVAMALSRHGAHRDALELLGSRDASGFVGDSSAEVAQRALAEASEGLGKRKTADALRQGRARDAPTATRLAIAALTRIIGGEP